jgi:hypothetical protein
MDNNKLVGEVAMQKLNCKIILTIIIFFLALTNTFAWKGDTHWQITDKTFEYLVAEGIFSDFPDNPGSPRALVRDGAVEEDEPLWDLRFNFHFYTKYLDPSIDPQLDSNYAWATCDAKTWAFIPRPCTATLLVDDCSPLPCSNTLTNDFNWMNATGVLAGTNSGWNSLAQVHE